MSWEDEDDDWENATADPPKDYGLAGVLENQWAGEDEDDDPLADGWDEDEDEDTKTEGTENSKVVPGEKRLTKRQIAKKREDDERRKREAREKLLAMSEEDKAKMKELERRRIEKEDLKLSSDMFGDLGELTINYNDIEDGATGNANADNADMAVSGSVDKIEAQKPKGVSDVELKTTNDYKKFAESLGGKVCGSVKPTLRGDTAKLVEFLKTLLTATDVALSLDEANDLKKHFNTVYNNKAKDPSKKKKAKKKNATGVVKMSAAGGLGNYGDDFVDYDF